MSAAPVSRLSLRVLTLLTITLPFFLITLMSWPTTPTVAAPPLESGDPSATLSGWFSIIWADGQPGTQLNYEEYWLTDDAGKMTRLQIEPALLESLGGSLALNGQRVSVQGTWLAPDVLKVATLQLQPARDAAATPAKPEVTGSQPWVTIPCKFADILTETKPISYFAQMYTSTYPGLDHYWREQSYNLANVQGSRSLSHWYTLPHTYTYYLLADNSPNTGLLFQDCTSVADPDVYFPDYVGINMMFNGYFSVSKGGFGTAILDGVTRTWYRTWEAEWGIKDIVVIEHEMGHGFGLPHSSANYGQTYDNAWDVMSDGWVNCSRSRDPIYGCLGQHTISWHKDKEGWITPTQKALITAGSHTVITLERTALPQTNNYLMAQLPVKQTADRFYTLEARRRAGYDVKLGGEGVIIHYVEIGRTNPARVIDIDNNGNTNDAGAMWIPGETFTDTVNGITVTVVSSTTTGYVVNVENRSFATLYYVTTTGVDSSNSCLNSAAPCATVQHAVDVADAGGEIRIAAGTYAGVSVRAGLTQTVYLSKSLTLRGGFTTSNWITPYPVTQTTTLDAQTLGRVVMIDSGQPLLEGLRLINGNATGLGGAWGDDGGGIYVDDGASSIIRNCIVSNSQARMGGGVFLAAPATLEGNTIISNSATMYGGGLHVFYADATTLSGNVFRANSSDNDGGGIFLYGSDANLSNNIIANNTATWDGSGIVVRNASPQFWHNTVARNTNSYGTGGVYLQGSTVATLVNTIVAGHTVGVYADTGSTAILTATLWASGAWTNTSDWSGPGSVSTGSINIYGDPAFLSPTTGDYHLAQTSAAIDRGVNTDVVTDIDADARPHGDLPDIGADEWYKRVNHAPLTPTNPSPVHGALDVWVAQQLGWQGSDPDSETVTYTIALGTSNPPGTVGQTSLLSFNPGQLLTNTHYYWKVTATDGVSTTIGPVWEFTTRNNATTYWVYLPLVLR